MSFLNSLKPLLKGQSEVTLTLKRTDKGYSLLVIPKLAEMEPETNDEELAHLQAVLALPFFITASEDADLDDQMASAIALFDAERQPELSAIEQYREAKAAAKAEAARVAAEAKSKTKSAQKPAKTTTTTPAKAPAPAPAAPPAQDLFSAAAGGAAAAPAPVSDAAEAPSDEESGDTDVPESTPEMPEEEADQTAVEETE